MKEIIRVRAKHGDGKRLAKVFGVTTVYVSQALTGKANSSLARKIRKAAVNNGGDPVYKEV